MELWVNAGDPAGPAEEGQGSFSRFVLPFAYRQEAAHPPSLAKALPALKPPQGSWDHLARWNRVEPLETFGQVSGRTRREYYTAETAEVLFGRRTARFRLAVPGAKPTAEEIRVQQRQADESWRVVARANLAAPELILFEFDPRERGEAGPLQMGLLVLSTHFESDEPPGAIPFSQLLTFNEVFRQTREPYAGYPYRLDLSALTWLQHVPERCGCGCPESDFQRLWLSPLDAPLLIEGDPYWLFSSESAAEARHPGGGIEAVLRTPMIHADGRAHTWTSVVCPSGAQVLHNSNPTLTRGWLRFLNVDRPGWGADADEVDGEFDRRWLQDHTYQRWAPGSLYGFSAHSGAAWLPDTRTWGDVQPLHQHFYALYFDQLALMLYLRSALFGFSREITVLTRRMQARQTNGAREFRRLERHFSVFTNLYQFPLLSHQQQALEMYAQLRRTLDVADFYDEVQDELRHLSETFDRRHDHLVRTIGMGFAVLASVGIVWGDFGLSDWARQEGLSTFRQAALLALLGALGWALTHLVIRFLDRRH